MGSKDSLPALASPTPQQLGALVTHSCASVSSCPKQRDQQRLPSSDTVRIKKEK